MQNSGAYDEGLDNGFWKPLKAWQGQNQEKHSALGFLNLKDTRWQYTASRIPNGLR